MPNNVNNNTSHVLPFFSLTYNSLENFYKKFQENIEAWKKFYDLSSPEEAEYPPPYDQIDEMLGLILLKCLRPDKVVPAVRVSFFIFPFL